MVMGDAGYCACGCGCLRGLRLSLIHIFVDIMSATIMKQHNPGLTDPQLRQLIAAHIDDDSFCRYVIPVSYTHLDVYKRQTIC